MHHIANVQVKNPVILIFDAKDSFHVVLQLYVPFFALLQCLLVLSHSLINIVISVLLG